MAEHLRIIMKVSLKGPSSKQIDWLICDHMEESFSYKREYIWVIDQACSDMNILTKQAWSIKDLLYGIKHHNMKMFLAGHNPYPERAR